MAAFVAAAGSAAGLGTSLTWSQTCSGTGSHRRLVVAVAVQGIYADPSSVTYAGANMTRQVTSNVSGRGVSIWALVNPATGANNVVVTMPGSFYILGHSIHLRQATATLTGATNGATGNTATDQPATSVSALVGDIVIDAVSFGPATGVPGAEQVANTAQQSADITRLTSSRETGAGASQNMTWTLTPDSGDVGWQIAAYVVVGADPVGQRTLLGVGT